MYGCDSWTVKKAERRSIWCFWTVVLEKTPESPLDCKEIQPVHSEGDQPWDFFGRNDAKAETPALSPPDAKSWLIGKDWCWEGLGAGEEGDDGGWDGWMASLTRWTWVWVNSGSWWWTGRPGVLRFMGLQRVRHNWATELIYTHCFKRILSVFRTKTPQFSFSLFSIQISFDTVPWKQEKIWKEIGFLLSILRNTKAYQSSLSFANVRAVWCTKE